MKRTLIMSMAAIAICAVSAVLFANWNAAVVSAADSQPELSNWGSMPSLDGAVSWLNSPPLSSRSLHGKVVLVNFWTYSCINSLRALPYMKTWAAEYHDAGLVVIGVHTPEFPFEKNPANVEMALRDLQVTYPVAIDSDYKVWQAFGNQYWPAFYFIDGKGRIRYRAFGEGDYRGAELVLRKLLRDNGATNLGDTLAVVSGQGVEAAPGNPYDQKSPETYIGYGLVRRFASPEQLDRDAHEAYELPPSLSLNEWGLGGRWKDGAVSAVLESAPGKIVIRFHSRDLHIVLGPAKDGKPVRFRVTLDDAAPGEESGTDCLPDGTGEIHKYRLYQLIRQKDQIRDRTFEIEFLDSGVQAFSFTFG